MISYEALQSQSTTQKAWLNTLENEELIQLGFSISQIQSIRSSIYPTLCSCPTFEYLGISQSTLLLSGINIHRIKDAIRNYIANRTISSVSNYYTLLLSAINTVLGEEVDEESLLIVRNNYDIISINNGDFSRFTNNELAWLSGAPIASLRKLGFSVEQIICAHLLGQPVTRVIPDFNELHVNKQAIVDCGIPHYYIRQGIRARYITGIIPTYYDQLLNLVSNLSYTSFTPSTVHTDTRTYDEPIAVLNTLEQEPVPEQTPIVVPPPSTSINYCEVDDERGVVYVSEFNGVETRETAHDLSVKYLGCYGLYQDIVIKINNIECYDEDDIRITFIPIQKELKRITRSISPDFNFSLPKLGLINTDFDIFCVERMHKRESPARYRKGLMPECLVYKNLCYFENTILKKTDLIRSVTSDYGSFYKVAEYVFKPISFTYKEALDSVLNADRVAAAFSSAYAVKVDLRINRIILLRYNYVIGTYSIRYNKWAMLTDAFNKSLIDLGVPL